jgi:hypothetical protein
MGGGGADAADVKGAAQVEAEANRRAAQAETWANRPDQTGPTSTTTWTNQMVDANTGRPIQKNAMGGWEYADVEPMENPGVGATPEEQQAYWAWISGQNGANIESVNSWEQNTQLNDQFQGLLDNSVDLTNSQINYRQGQQNEWQANGADFGGGIGGGSIKPGQTIGTGDLAQFGQTNPNLGAQDWRQFGTSDQTVGADDYRQFGTTGQTIDAKGYEQFGKTDSQIGGDDWRQFGNTESQIGGDDWRQFGNTEQTIGAGDWEQYGNTEQTLGAGDYDARFGEANADPTGGYGAHDQGGGDWNQIQYTPDAIRRQAESETMAYMNSQLDPQWDRRQEDLEVQLANQGLQWGDAAFDNAMESMKNSRDTAYGGARNQALADSRAEANMLWGQEMSRSEQKNMQTQADLDNTYRARQANIGNAQAGSAQEQQNYLAYQREAFGQDLSSRQQTLDSSLNFGREAHQQDFTNRQQQLDANLNYGREGFNQDLAGRQQQINANLDYGREGFSQDLQGRQQQINSDLAYGSEAYNQDLNSRQQQLDADLGYGREAFSQDLQGRQQQIDANRQYSNDAFNQDLQSRQANISNYLNYGSEGFQQDLAGNQLNLNAMTEAERANQQRYGLVNPNETAGTIAGLVG